MKFPPLAKYFKNSQVDKRKDSSVKNSPFENNSAGKDTKEDSDEFSTDHKNLEEKTGALTALYGRMSKL